MTEVKLIKDLTVEEVSNNTNNLYVFGDNTKRTGKAGQAIIRNLPNTFGVVTKRLPSMTKHSFFEEGNNEDLESLLFDVFNLTYIIHSGKYETVYLPYYGLGTGLAALYSNAPTLYFLILKHIYNANGHPVPHLYKFLDKAGETNED